MAKSKKIPSKSLEEKIYSWQRQLEHTRDSVRPYSGGIAGYLGIIALEMRKELEKTVSGKKLLSKPALLPS